MSRRWRIILAMAFLPAAARGDDALFRERVAPLFETRCVRCHSGAKPKGGLSLETAAALARGGESGAAIVAGEPEESLLLDYISGDEPPMPKEGKPLSAGEVAAIREWIET